MRPTSQTALATLGKAGLPPRLMIDTSHGNSDKDYRRQPLASLATIGEQVAAGERGIIGVMMESFLVDGRQDLADKARPRLRPEHHRRLHGLGDDRAGAPRAGRVGPSAARGGRPAGTGWLGR